VARHPTKVEVRRALEANLKTEEAELLVKLLRDPDWVRPLDFEARLADFIEREHLTPRKRGRQASEPGSLQHAHVVVAWRMVWRRVLRVQEVLAHQGRTAPEKLLAAALRRVAEETGLHLRTVRRHYDTFNSEIPPAKRPQVTNK
jgi:hypothetical protein